MIEKLREAALKKIEAARAETLLQIVQLSCSTMQELGERHTMFKAKYEGLGLAMELIEEAHAELLGKEDEPETQEQGPYT